jgi:hypothetical protein
VKIKRRESVSGIFQPQQNISSFEIEEERGSLCQGMAEALSPDNKLLAVIPWLTRNVKILNAQSGEVLSEIIIDHPDKLGARGVQFTPDSLKVAVTYGPFHTIYDALTGKEMSRGNTPVGASRIYFSPDGAKFFTAEDNNTATIRDTATGAILQTLSGHTQKIMRGSFSPDGTRIVTASLDHTARIWDADTGDELIVLKGHTGPLSHARFSDDGLSIVTVSRDKTCRVWTALPWREQDLPGDSSQPFISRLGAANRNLKMREPVEVSRSVSQEFLCWAIYQVLQIPDIFETATDGMEGYTVGTTDQITPLCNLGLASGDRIFKINENLINSGQELVDALKMLLGSLPQGQPDKISIVFERQGQQVNRIYEFGNSNAEHKEVNMPRVLVQASFELILSYVPDNTDIITAENYKWANVYAEPENARSIYLTVPQATQYLLEQFGLMREDRLCSINGIRITRLEKLLETILNIKTQVESGEVNEIAIVAQRGDSTRVETVITMTD